MSKESELLDFCSLAFGGLKAAVDEDRAKVAELLIANRNAVDKMTSVAREFDADFKRAADRGIKSALGDLRRDLEETTRAAKAAQEAYEKAARFALKMVVVAGAVIVAGVVITAGGVIYFTSKAKTEPPVLSLPTGSLRWCNPPGETVACALAYHPTSGQKQWFRLAAPSADK